MSVLKMYIMHFGLYNPNHVYTVNNVAIAFIHSSKDLGFYIPDTLSWWENIFEITKKTSPCCKCHLACI